MLPMFIGAISMAMGNSIDEIKVQAERERIEKVGLTAI